MRGIWRKWKTKRLKLSYGAGAPVIEFTYDDEGDWPVESDGDGYSLVRRDLDANADLSAGWELGGRVVSKGTLEVWRLVILG